MTDINIDELLPHRDRMRLVDEVIEVNEKKAVTRSKVTENWPLFEDDSVNPIVLIELVACGANNIDSRVIVAKIVTSKDIRISTSLQIGCPVANTRSFVVIDTVVVGTI